MFRYWLYPALLCFPCLSVALDIQQITGSVWIAIQPDGNRFNDSNSLIMQGDDGVLVVDSQQSYADVTRIIEFIRRQIGLPVTVLINTHWHADHTQGNALYKDVYGEQLTIIGHPSYLEDIPHRAEKNLNERIQYLQTQLPVAIESLQTATKKDGLPMDEAEIEAQTKAIERARQWLKANKNAQFVLPDRLIDEPLTLSDYGFTARVIPMSGHTRADLVVYLPEQQILASGDLLDAVPYLGHGNTRQWLASLERMQALSPVLWLPGHGELHKDNRLLDAIRDYFEELLFQVNQHQHIPLDKLEQHIDVSASRARLTGSDPHKQRFFDHSLDEAITQTYESERQHRAQ